MVFTRTVQYNAIHINIFCNPLENIKTYFTLMHKSDQLIDKRQIKTTYWTGTQADLETLQVQRLSFLWHKSSEWPLSLEGTCRERWEGYYVE